MTICAKSVQMLVDIAWQGKCVLKVCTLRQGIDDALESKGQALTAHHKNLSEISKPTLDEKFAAAKRGFTISNTHCTAGSFVAVQ
jgi:hypothetical protein